ncbi:MAG: type II toxin-antitoxin system VapC family toxin [Brevundimonas sp.]|uniref:type II toxin-antitoxin system VapC family toxin n=1 Tax=Brevundimonas sp. TaxID=1871086 RepID=UPI0025C5EBD8|nr:type II toxin-antitoxin system VapC family toxin [Brevundimonas sp.]MBX3477638.1 type II toxin-antitoxin system VapC family toxin [Brevundimonas sp.]
MVIDTSILFAIEFLEPEAEVYDAMLRSADVRLMSVASAVELLIVLTRRRRFDQSAAVNDLIQEYGIELTPVDEGQMRLAWAGFARFGKGGGHPAQLNFGDCFSYALTRASGQPLMFKGTDFALTDVQTAVT